MYNSMSDLFIIIIQCKSLSNHSNIKDANMQVIGDAHPVISPESTCFDVKT